MRRVRAGIAAGVAAAAVVVVVVTAPATAGPADADSSFGDGGSASPALGPGSHAIEAVALQPDGRIVVAGSSQPTAGSDGEQFTVARLTSTGALDATFGTGGVVRVDAGGRGSQATDVAVLADGDVVAVGYAEGETARPMIVQRLNADGTPDAGFGDGSTPGRVQTQLGFDSARADGVAVAPGGDLLVAGNVEETGASTAKRAAIARFDATGDLVSSWGSSGVAASRHGATTASYADIAVRDGKVVGGGTAYVGGHEQFLFAVYGDDGSFDGAAFTRFGTASTGASEAEAVGVAADGKVVLAGHTTDLGTRRVAVARMDPSTGMPDPAFDTDGRVSLEPGSLGAGARAVLIGADGSVTVAGESATNSRVYGLVARWTASGAPDTGFAGGSNQTLTEFTGADNHFAAIAGLPSGKLLVAGRTRTAALVARLGSAGSAPAGTIAATQDLPSAEGTKPLRPHHPITLAASASDADGSVVAYAWDLDDDGTDDATGPETSVTFDQPGSHPIRLRLRDDEGLTTTITRTLDIVRNAAPVAGFHIGTPVKGVATKVSAEASADADGSIVEYAWSFDGNLSYGHKTTSPTIIHSFDRTGPRLVGLKVTDDEGATHIVTRQVDVAVPGFGVSWTNDGKPTLDLPSGAWVSTRIRISRKAGSTAPVSLRADSAAKIDWGFVPVKDDPDLFELRLKADPSEPTGKRTVIVTAEAAPHEGPFLDRVNIPVHVRAEQYDARIDGIEITQGVQRDFSECSQAAEWAGEPPPELWQAPGVCTQMHSLEEPYAGTQRLIADYGGVTLVKGRQTVVRVFAAYHYRNPALPFDVKLERVRGAKVVDSLNASLSGPKKLELENHPEVSVADRGTPDRPFTFVLPPHWTKNDYLSIRATLVRPPVDEKCGKDCDRNNAMLLRDIAFTELPRIRVGFARLNTYPEDLQASSRFGPAPKDPWAMTYWPYVRDLVSDARALSPAPLWWEDRYLLQFWYDGHADKPDRQGEKDALYEFEDDAADYQATCGGPKRPCVHQMVGITSSRISTAGRSTSDVQSNEPDPHASVAFWGSPKTVAHELVHGWDVEHAHDGACSDDEDQWGEPIDESGRGHLAGVGLDPRPWQPGTTKQAPFRVMVPGAVAGGQITPTSGNAAQWYDFMSYCGGDWNRWISVPGWARYIAAAKSVGNALGGDYKTVDGARAAQGAGRKLVVRGVVDGGGAVRIVASRPRDRGPSVPGSSRYVLRGIDATGATRAESPMRMADVEGSDELALAGAVPLDGVAAVMIVRDGAEVARRAASAAPPAVRLTSPRAGTRLRGDRPLPVTWTATDPDGDGVDARVEFSTDGGRSWRLVGGGDAGRLVLARQMLEGTRRARIRISVSDGFHQAQAVSKVFRVDPRPPRPYIAAPVRGQRVAPGATVLLEGGALADGGGVLGRRGLLWLVDGRRAGRGASAAVDGLAPGRHRVTLVARHRGRSRRATTVLRVDKGPVRLTVLKVPRTLPRGARHIRIRLASTYPAAVRILGRRVKVRPKARTVRLPVKPGTRRLMVKIRRAGLSDRDVVVRRR